MNHDFIERYLTTVPQTSVDREELCIIFDPDTANQAAVINLVSSCRTAHEWHSGPLRHNIKGSKFQQPQTYKTHLEVGRERHERDKKRRRRRREDDGTISCWRQGAPAFDIRGFNSGYLKIKYRRAVKFLDTRRRLPVYISLSLTRRTEHRRSETIE